MAVRVGINVANMSVGAVGESKEGSVDSENFVLMPALALLPPVLMLWQLQQLLEQHHLMLI